MRLFSFDWLRSSERKELQALQLENAKLENELLKKQLEEYSDIRENFYEPVINDVEEPKSRPFQKMIYRDGSITIVTWDGDTISSEITPEIFKEISSCTSLVQIIDILSNLEVVPPVKGRDDSEDDIALVEESKHILLGDKDFEKRGNDLFLKGVNLALVPVVLASFIEIAEKISAESDTVVYGELEEYNEALKMFWRWTALNPIESSRRDLLTFVKQNDISITSNGLLELFRRICKVENTTNNELLEYVSEQYIKVKKAKKGPGNFLVYKESGEYTLYKNDPELALGDLEYIGNLKDLYNTLKESEENIYTDNYTHTKEIKIGYVYKEDENKIDLDNTVSCSNGLHAGSRSFGFDGAGDTGVCVLVNPMKVRAVPTYSNNKMRVSEMFIMGIMDEDKFKKEESSISTLSQEYSSIILEEIETLLKDKSYEKLECKGNKPKVAIQDIVDITDVLRNRIVKL